MGIQVEGGWIGKECGEGGCEDGVWGVGVRSVSVRRVGRGGVWGGRVRGGQECGEGRECVGILWRSVGKCEIAGREW